MPIGRALAAGGKWKLGGVVLFHSVKSKMAQEISATLQERGNRYGTFSGHAEVSQAIKKAMATGRNWDKLSADKREALEMVAHKVARILNGDPEYHDSWHDIIGYTKLVADALDPA